MIYDIIKLRKNLVEVQNKLDLLVDSESSEYEDLFNQSVRIDRVVAKYNEARYYLYNEKKKLMKKYENELNMPFKDKIIGEIRTETRAKFPSVGIPELFRFSSNVYIYATLLAHNIDEQKIVNQLVYLNNKYLEDVLDDKGSIENNKIDADYEYWLYYLLNKYKQIIKDLI